MQEQGGKEAQVKGEKPSAMGMSGDGFAGQSAASIPTCHEALPAGVHGQEYQTEQRLQPSLPHCTSMVFNSILFLSFHYSSFHVRKTIGLIEPTWTQSCCSANGASLASASSKDFYLFLSKLLYPLLPLPSRCSAQP